MFPRVIALLCLIVPFISSAAAPPLLDEQFELPSGFHIYKACGPELSGGSYAMTFDGQGRLLVGDGNAVRRLTDRDNDGVFDASDVIATNLGWRGPQGLLVYGDKLYAVGGDGVQVFEGYSSTNALVHKGRIGQKFLTGGDHDAHTILRGHDGYLYLMAGNGAGISGRTHITEQTSPCLIEREASVFRISPDGQKWECIANGGRNPPNLGMNYLGELFSFDSDMEWHVGLPWYRPVRLNHWAIGGDQGWHDVGAYPPYYIDCLPGILDAGRGSPNWGTFYEHTQLPEKYRNAYIVCDYRWKRESNDQYATSGRLVVFFLQRRGAGWTATMETLARPKPNARDAEGKPISFALVDVQVAPDGSLFVSDHNQGVWRIFYGSTAPAPFASMSAQPSARTAVDEVLSLPQPGAEWSRVRAERIRVRGGSQMERELVSMLSDRRRSLEKRLAALRFLSADFHKLRDDLITKLVRDPAAEIRAQAAWLLGLRANTNEVIELNRLSRDSDPFVRRRAAEAFTRIDARMATPAVVHRLADEDRLVRYVAMNALAHRPTADWFELATETSDVRVLLRALIAASLRDDLPPVERSRVILERCLRAAGREDRLDLLRVVALFRKQVENDPELKRQIAQKLVQEFPDSDPDIRWEQARLIGELRVNDAFPKLLSVLESETNHVTQFHFAQSVAKLNRGWTDAEQQRLVRWFLGTQRGWFAEYDAKGVEFPQFWATVLSDLARHHRDALLAQRVQIDFGTELGGVALESIASSPDGAQTLLKLYREQTAAAARLRIARAMRKIQSADIAALLRREANRVSDESYRGALLRSLATQRIGSEDVPLFAAGLANAEREVVRDCAAALAKLKAPIDEPLSRSLLVAMNTRRDLFHPLQNALVALTAARPPQYSAAAQGTPDRTSWEAAKKFWFNWYAAQFGKEFEATSAAVRTDEEIHRFLTGTATTDGNAERGARVYETLQCNTCHGGGVTPGREGAVFGPDLAGIARRLTRRELADALVFPSKQVADRFKGFVVSTQDGNTFTGFITEQNDNTVTLADRDQVHRFERKQIQAVEPQSTSLMPSGLLNRLSWDEIRDLMAFLENGSSK